MEASWFVILLVPNTNTYDILELLCPPAVKAEPVIQVQKQISPKIVVSGMTEDEERELAELMEED